MANKSKEMSETEKKLFECVLDGKLAEVKQLLNEPGVKVDCLDDSGMTPLQQAAFKGHRDIAELLLARGADVNSNHHQHGYTALMFAALSGKTEVTRLMLEAGAKTSVQNNMGRNAAQMGAFVGQTQCVSLINNFYSKEDLDYYTVPRGVEAEPKLPPALSSVLYKFILINNLCPVRLGLYLDEHSELLDEYEKIHRLLEHLTSKVMKCKETNEVMGIKFHYFATMVKAVGKAKKEGSVEKWIKNLLRGRPSDGFPVLQEKFLRDMLKEFPYFENQLIQQICRTIAPVTLGNEPTALSVLTNSINGQRFANEDDNQCYSCMDFHAPKRCSACNMVTYCNQRCQKLHWFQHKISCKILAEEYKRQQKRKAEEERLKKEEEEKNKEKSVSESSQKELEQKTSEILIEENGASEPKEKEDNKETAEVPSS